MKHRYQIVVRGFLPQTVFNHFERVESRTIEFETMHVTQATFLVTDQADLRSLLLLLWDLNQEIVSVVCIQNTSREGGSK